MTDTEIKILLIEDNPGDARLIEIMLAEAKVMTFDLAWVDNLAAGLERLKSEWIDVVLLDLGLPESSGLDTLTQLLAQAPTVPTLVVLSGLSDETIAVQAVQSGAQDYLVKGQVNSALLVRSIRYAIERSQAEEALRQAHGELERRVAERTAELASAVEALHTEIAERKHAEAELREREARIRRLVESNIIGVFFWDVKGAITDANDAFLDIGGYSRDDLSSGRLRWTDITPSEYRVMDELALTHLQSAGSITPYEKEYIRKDGRHVPILVGATMFEGSTESGIAFVLDLTERKQAEKEREARRVAEAANLAKNQFLANMSHELRTPLNGILGYAQILRRDPTLSERQLEGLNVIRQSGEHLLTLINDILDFAKIEAGKLELFPTDISLARFLRVIVQLISIKARQKSLDFVYETAPNLPAGIRADERRLRQVLLNLLANAVQFTDRGQVTLRVRFSPPAQLRFEVQDTGIGIGEEQFETIFQAFEQVGQDRFRRGGTGLGLAISRQFVRLMGGDIHIESRLGEGSLFWFELDVAVVKAGPAAWETAGRLIIGYAGPRRIVLVVDDSAENRAVLVDMLAPLGFEVVEVASGRDALERAEAVRPGLILMDLVMPEMDGLETSRRLRQSPALRRTPIIMISARTSGTGEQSSFAAGVNAFLPKPVILSQLLTQIASVLELDWEYAETTISNPEGETAGPLVAPPAPEMDHLHQLAKRGNMRAIEQHAARIAKLDQRYHPFADRLRLLAKGYQSQAILNLVEQYLDSERTGDTSAEHAPEPPA